MNQRIAIRQAVVADLDAVEAIEQACFAAGDAFSRRVLRRLICHAQGAVWVAEYGGCVVGYTSLLVRRTACNVRIYSVAVAPLGRGCGVGQALVDAALGEAQLRGLQAVTLEVRADNEMAMRLYLKNGFQVQRRLPAYYHDGSDGWRMVRVVE